MENGKARDPERDMDEVNLQVAQLQALAMELKAGLVGAVQDLCTLKRRSSSLEERMADHHSDMEGKILGLTNALNAFKEELVGTLTHIREVNSRHVETQRGLQLFQAEVGRRLLACQQRKSSKDVSPVCQRRFLSETEHSVIQHYFASLPNDPSQQTTNSDQDVGCLQQGPSVCPVWVEQKDTADRQSPRDSSERQTAALELLESERIYVSYLSLLLKANITFNGSEAVHLKDKRLFPSALRFLIQQHLELLHTLQERVLHCQWQGMLGDVFLRMTSKESDFLELYVAYLTELPACVSALSAYSAASLQAAGLLEGDVAGDNETRPPLHTLLLQPVQRIPEYLALLQTLLEQTDAGHPDHFLLLLSLQQLSAFSARHAHLLRHSEELLAHEGRERHRQHLMQVRTPQDWELDDSPATPCFPGDARTPAPPCTGSPRRPNALSPAPPWPTPVTSSCCPPPPLPPAREGLYDDGEPPGRAAV
ncbi:hypothetical protein AAFF_G00255700 [Aldrovandia affinis]|uniref:DH domain-containing protein n=1 Tax=Aldrovandia affinis TaxID=143900 RepID=A0AAD7RCE6_9TELE|nr:hypothetical protein AAFF_G00255700 [Aldrovandia affinis]